MSNVNSCKYYDRFIDSDRISGLGMKGKGDHPVCHLFWGEKFI